MTYYYECENSMHGGVRHYAHDRSAIRSLTKQFPDLMIIYCEEKYGKFRIVWEKVGKREDAVDK